MRGVSALITRQEPVGDKVADPRHTVGPPPVFPGGEADTDSLFAVGDGGTSVVQVSKTAS
jgi:hypothetical protein